MGDHPPYMWNMARGVPITHSTMHFDAPGLPISRHAYPHPPPTRRHLRNSSADNNLLPDPYGYPYDPASGSAGMGIGVGVQLGRPPSMVDPGYGDLDVGIPIIPPQESPIVHARPYVPPPLPVEPPRRQLPLPRSNSVQFREVDFMHPANLYAPMPEPRPLARTKTLPPPPPPNVSAEPSPPRMPPPYRPPPEPPGRPAAPKPSKAPPPPLSPQTGAPAPRRVPILGLEPASPTSPSPKSTPPPPPPQAPPRRRHSQGNLQQMLQSERGHHNNHVISVSTDDLLDGSAEDVKISVRDRKKLFDSFSSENLLQSPPQPPAPVIGLDASKNVVGSRKSTASATTRASLGSHDPTGKQFTLACAVNDVDKILAMLRDCPALAHWRDPVTGYSAIHWAARKGNLDVLTALLSVEGFDGNVRTAGGYTALHLAAQFNRDEFYEKLAGTLGVDSMVRDYSGKKPYQYRQKQAASISVSVLNRINVRKSQQQQERDPKLLRLGSINVRVKKTAEVLNQMIGGGSGHGGHMFGSRLSNSSSNSHHHSEKRPHSVVVLASKSLTGSTKSLASSSSSGEDRIARRFSSVDPSDSSSQLSLGDGSGSQRRRKEAKNGSCVVDESECDDFAAGFGREWQAS